MNRSKFIDLSIFLMFITNVILLVIFFNISWLVSISTSTLSAITIYFIIDFMPRYRDKSNYKYILESSLYDIRNLLIALASTMLRGRNSNFHYWRYQDIKENIEKIYENSKSDEFYIIKIVQIETIQKQKSKIVTKIDRVIKYASTSNSSYLKSFFKLESELFPMLDSILEIRSDYPVDVVHMEKKHYEDTVSTLIECLRNLNCK